MHLEERKIKEIEHSRQRRLILQGDERHIDTNEAERVKDGDRLIRDKEAFSHHFSNVKFYSITRESETYLHNWMRRYCIPGTKVIDFACGNGENGIYAAACGADVIGIDISPEGVANANINAVEAEVATSCRFEVMDGEKMTFPDNSFDFGVEYGALHHVELDTALSELRRVIKPGGKMVCVEALRHNPFIHAYRKRTPHLRTEWEVEHILGVESLKVAKKYFRTINVRFFHLFSLAAVPLRKTPFFRPVRWVLDRVDRFILSNSLIGKYAWIMIFEMSDPIKSDVR
ncbi:MAG: class I SAM-dependent methyltransferase [Parcubacteria group bacterium]